MRLAGLGVSLLLLTSGACSLLTRGPLCMHPSCLEHLELGASEEEVLSGTWAEADWRRAEYFGPVGRDLVVQRCYASVSPLAFEDGELLGWSHRFQAQDIEKEGALRHLEGLQSGDAPGDVRLALGAPDRIVPFRSDDGEVFEIWSWADLDVALCLARFLEFDPLQGVEVLDEELQLRGYVEGFLDFRAE